MLHSPELVGGCKEDKDCLRGCVGLLIGSWDGLEQGSCQTRGSWQS